MGEWQGTLPTHSRVVFPCGWKIGTRQTPGWWKKRGGSFGLRCPLAFLLLSQCPAPVLLSEASRSRGWCTSLPCTAAPRGPALLSTCRKITLAGSTSANDSRGDSVVASFGQPQEGNRPKLTFSWMRCPAQQKEGTRRALPWELPVKDVCSQLAGGWTWMSSTSLVLQLPASSALLLSHQQVTEEEQQRHRGDPVPVLMDKAWWELLEHLNK